MGYNSVFSMELNKIPWGSVVFASACMTLGTLLDVPGLPDMILGSRTQKILDTCDDDIPENVKNWIRESLIKQGIKNVDMVPLKKAKNNSLWDVIGGKAIVIGNQECDKLSESLKAINNLNYNHQDDVHYRNVVKNQFFLNHEISHYLKKDYKSSSFFDSMMIGTLPFFVACGMFLAGQYNQSVKIGSLVGAMLLLVSHQVLSTVLTRHQEEAADRFACKSIQFKEDLVIIKDCWLDKAVERENILLNSPENYTVNLIAMFMLPVVSKKLNGFKALLATDIDLKEKKSLKISKEKWNRFGEFLFDRDHPYLRDRAAIVQEYIDEWDKKRLLRS